MEFFDPSVHSAPPAVASTVADDFDTWFFSTKKINVLLDDDDYLLWRQQMLLGFNKKTLSLPALSNRIVHLRHGSCLLALHSQRKGDLSMKDFLMKIKGVMTMLIDAEARHQAVVLESPSLANMVSHQAPISATSSERMHVWARGSHFTLDGVTTEYFSFCGTLSPAWMVHSTNFSTNMVF
ncbi:hypothetical protein GOBAR_AA16087 [Gossypium barbadense]|uniref:Retrotransposon Copia-like N-terminal domain-containing protein n=1 Tax=Gossypium barbadense TaxID=3634 RepID=A0A2P5XMM6_GOSBA|nr:hypothetical protein GOBAR_AA16087 [Gossypium barbadense]